MAGWEGLAGLGGALSGFGNSFGAEIKKQDTLADALKKAQAGQAADVLQQTADQVAKGTIAPAQAEALMRANGINVPAGHFDQVQPSVSSRLAGIMGGIDKASSYETVPSDQSLMASGVAQRLPVSLGRTASPSADGSLPSTQMQPASPEMDSLMGAKAAKLASFPPTKQSVTLPSGATEDQYLSSNPATLTGQSFPTGLSANQKAVNDLAAWKTNEGSPERATIEGQNKLTQFTQNEGSPARAQMEATSKNTVLNQTRAATVKTAAQTSGAEAGARANAEMNAEAARYGLTSKQVATAGSLADNFETESKPFFITQDAFRKMATASQAPSRAGDMSIIFNYMKMLDPNSTVREGEYAKAEQVGSIPDRIWNMYNKFLSDEGGILPPAARADLMKQASGIYQADAQGHKERVQTYTQRAGMMKIPPSLVIRDTSPVVGASADMLRPAPTPGAAAKPILDSILNR